MQDTRANDRYEIEQLFIRYAWMTDERKWEMMDDLFVPEGTIDYTSTGGVVGPYRSTLEWLDRALSGWPINLHYLTNLTIEFDGDTARSRCYFFAPMGRRRDDGSQEVISNGGYYFDNLVKTADGWRIRERLCTQTTMIGQLPTGYDIPD